jgi:hypothetical protein
MALSLSEEIRETFRKAALQREAAHGLSGDDWARYRDIQSDHDRRRSQEQRDYQREYDTRVETMRSRLIDQAGTADRTFAPRFLGRDGFDKDAIERQAHRNVRDDHDRALARLEAEKEARLALLMGAAQKRRDLADRLRNDFAEATDRRSGDERRSGPIR